MNDLISKAEAIEHFMRLSEDESLTPYTQMLMVGVSNEIKKLPSADRPRDGDLISRAEAIEAIEIVDWYHQNSNKDMVHGANDDEHQAWYKADDVYKALEAVPSADRPKGRWHYSDGKPATIGQSFGVICDQCGTESEYCTNFCGECGADMRGDTK